MAKDIASTGSDRYIADFSVLAQESSMAVLIFLKDKSYSPTFIVIGQYHV